MFSVSTSYQNKKKPRCLECKRRKKKCEPIEESKSCDFCWKKGFTCQFENAEQSIEYPNIEKSKRSKSLTKIGPMSNVSITDLTPSSFVKLLNELRLFDGGNNVAKFTFVVNPLLYIPNKTISNNSKGIPTIEDAMTRYINNDNMLLPNKFAVGDFLMSSIRVNYISDKADPSHNITSDFLNFIKTSASKGFIENIKQNHEQSVTETSMRNINLIKKSLNEVELRIDANNLERKLHCKEAAVEFSSKFSCNKFVNLPEYIDNDFAMYLFNHFCDTCQDDRDSTQKDDDSKISKVTLLMICLPLILGNVCVLKCVLILSYYDLLIHHDKELLRSLEQVMLDLHLEVVNEINHQLTFSYSVCCDHSLICVIFLLKIETLKGCRGSLWVRLIGLAQNMIALRGGVFEITKTLTGLCLVRLCCGYLVAGNSKFEALKYENEDPFNIGELLIGLENHSHIDFFDNFHSLPNFGHDELFSIYKLYGSITQLCNLVSVSYTANTIGSTEIKNDDKKVINVLNLKTVLNESSTLEEKISSNIGKLKDVDHHYHRQLLFTIRASQLYLYQGVYKQNSASIKTIVVVEELLSDFKDLMEEIQGTSHDRKLLFVLPLFLLGVDLISSSIRIWYKEKIFQLYTLTKKESLLTCIDLLDRVWALNEEGTKYVDWKELSEDLSLYICLID